MKYFLLSFLFLNLSHAGIFSVIGPCDEEPLFEQEIGFNYSSNAGDITVAILKGYGIPFIGSSEGMNSIYGTPTGDEAIEIISDREMLAYGWCYKVNDFEPGDYPNQVSVKPSDNLTWWFGYAHYKDGEWIAQCEPSYLRKSPQFCKD